MISETSAVLAIGKSTHVDIHGAIAGKFKINLHHCWIEALRCQKKLETSAKHLSVKFKHVFHIKTESL